MRGSGSAPFDVVSTTWASARRAPRAIAPHSTARSSARVIVSTMEE